MKRRLVLTATAGAAAGAALAAPLTATAPTPTTLTVLARLVANAREDLSASRLAALGDSLPTLLATAQATVNYRTGADRIRATGLLARLLTVAGHQQYRTSQEASAAESARTARSLAEEAEHEVATAEAERIAAVVARRIGDTAAVGRMVAAADRLESATGLSDAEALATWAETICSAAYTTAGFGDLTLADSLTSEAHLALEAIERPTSFTITDTAVFVMSCAMHAGEYDLVLERARHVDVATIDNGHELAHYWKNVAIAAAECGDHDRAVAALTQINETTPDFLAFRPWVRELASDLVATKAGGSSLLVRRLAMHGATAQT